MADRELVCCGKCRHFVKIRLKPRQKSTKKFYRCLQERGNLTMGKYRLNLLNKHLRNSNVLSIQCSKCSWRRIKLGQTTELHELQKVYLAALEVRPPENSFQSPATSNKRSDSKTNRKLKKKSTRKEGWDETHGVRNEVTLLTTKASSESKGLDKRLDISLVDSLGIGPSVSTPHCVGQNVIKKAKISDSMAAPITPTNASTLSSTSGGQATAKSVKLHPHASTPASREKKGQFHQQLQLMLQKEKGRNTGAQSLANFLQSLQHV